MSKPQKKKPTQKKLGVRNANPTWRNKDSPLKSVKPELRPKKPG